MAVSPQVQHPTATECFVLAFLQETLGQQETLGWVGW
jgi:hypothetical protein